MDNTFLQLEDILPVLHLGRTTAYRMIQSGQLPARKIGGRWLIKREDFNNYLDGKFSEKESDAKTKVKSSVADNPNPASGWDDLASAIVRFFNNNPFDNTPMENLFGSMRTFGQIRTFVGSHGDELCAVEIHESGVEDPDAVESYDEIEDVPHTYDVCTVESCYFTFQKSKGSAKEIPKDHSFLKVTLIPCERPEIYENVPGYILQRISHD